MHYGRSTRRFAGSPARNCYDSGSITGFRLSHYSGEQPARAAETPDTHEPIKLDGDAMLEIAYGQEGSTDSTNGQTRPPAETAELGGAVLDNCDIAAVVGEETAQAAEQAASAQKTHLATGQFIVESALLS